MGEIKKRVVMVLGGYIVISAILGGIFGWMLSGILLTLLFILVAVMYIRFLVRTGVQSQGPLGHLCVGPILKKYCLDRKGEVIFYGASNFRLWPEMDQDLAPYKVQNHGIGGASDESMMKFAEELVFQYEPAALFFQTGSNDYALGRTVAQVKENKKKMYQEYRNRLPGVPLVVMSGLPLPGRPQFWPQIKEVNEFLEEYCSQYPDMYFVDATQLMMTEDGKFRPELFKPDQIHLNHEGQMVWSEPIKEMLARIQAPQVGESNGKIDL